VKRMNLLHSHYGRNGSAHFGVLVGVPSESQTNYQWPPTARFIEPGETGLSVPYSISRQARVKFKGVSANDRQVAVGPPAEPGSDGQLNTTRVAAILETDFPST